MEQTKLNVNDLFLKVCTNANPSSTWTKNKDGKPVRKQQWYRHPDLHRFAKDAFEKGKSYFYTEPVNPKNPYGPQKPCEPKFVYKLRRDLSEDEFKTLVQAVEEYK